MDSESSLEKILPIIRYNNACRDAQDAKALWWLENVFIPRLVKKGVKPK